MAITSYSREEIRRGLEEAQKYHDGVNDHIRLLFAPTVVDDENFERVCDIYSRIEPGNYDTVVVIETYEEILDKKLAMASNSAFETPFGPVPVNDYMRNEFCDEDDDFFIHDEGFGKEMSLFQQLMLLQCIYEDFSAVSIQIADHGPAIVKELAYVLEEVLASRNALLVFCCKLDNEYTKEFAKIKKMINDNDKSGLLNYLNSGKSRIKGAAAFIAGVLVAKMWELKLNFLDGRYEQYNGSLLTAYADRQKVFF